MSQSDFLADRWPVAAAHVGPVSEAVRAVLTTRRYSSVGERQLLSETKEQAIEGAIQFVSRIGAVP